MLKTLFSKILAGAIALSCLTVPTLESTAQAQERVVVEVLAPCAPPLARVETVVVRRGWVWSYGHWYWNSGSWVWIPGHHVRVVRGQRWIHPHYIVRGPHWVFVRGRWAR